MQALLIDQRYPLSPLAASQRLLRSETENDLL